MALVKLCIKHKLMSSHLMLPSFWCWSRFFFWQGGGVGHTKKKKLSGMWDLKLLDQGSNPSSVA